MRYPTLNSKGMFKTSVPELNGGINVSKSVTEIDDNQLTDSMNMWYHRGHLQTRPGVRYVGESIPNLKYTGYDVKLRIDWSGLESKLYSVWYTLIHNKSVETTELRIYFVDENGLHNLAKSDEEPKYFISHTFDYIVENGTNGGVWFAPYTKGSSAYLYAYIATGSSIKEILKIPVFDDEYTLISTLISSVTDDEFEEAAPTVIVNNDFGDDARVRGTTFEGYNAINGKYKVMCTTNDESIYVYMPCKQVNGTNIKIDFYTTLFGQKTLTLTEEETDVWTASVSVTGIESSGGVIYGTVYATFSNATDTTGVYPLMLWFCNGSDTTKLPVGKGSGSSNLTVYLTREVDLSKSDKISYAQEAIWYGGDIGGLTGGSYLFVFQRDTSFMCWSDINSPLYFPEGNRACIGDNNEAISTIAKMNDILVIFKTNSIYYITYSSGESVTVDQLINGEVTDVTAYSAVFPIVCIHNSIGCDLPNTVQLCRNRLVWANSNGKVYEIVTHAYTSERNVYEISNNIENLLKSDEFFTKQNYNDKTQAFSADWNGFYVLSFGGKDIYLMNYNNYGFTNIYSYSKTDDAQNRLQWYRWRLPDKVKALHNQNCELILCIEDDIGNRRLAVTDDKLYQDEISETDKRNIPSCFATKVFDFGYPEIYKSMEQLYFGAGSEQNGELTLSFVTHRGETAERKIPLEARYSNSPDYIKEYRQLPMQRRVRTFGLKFSSDGQFAFNGYSIKWKQLGSVR